MITLGHATSCVDPTANLTAEQKRAASAAGYGIPFISDEAKFAQAEAMRLGGSRPVDLHQSYKQAATPTKTTFRTALYRQYVEPIILAAQMAFQR